MTNAASLLLRRSVRAHGYVGGRKREETTAEAKTRHEREKPVASMV